MLITPTLVQQYRATRTTCQSYTLEKANARKGKTLKTRTTVYMPDVCRLTKMKNIWTRQRRSKKRQRLRDKEAAAAVHLSIKPQSI
jgi:hypothetical protein